MPKTEQLQQARFRVGSQPKVAGESELSESLARSTKQLAARQVAQVKTAKPATAKPKPERKKSEKFEVAETTLSYNEKHEGLELRFPPPSVKKIDDYAAVSDFLKEQGWKFAKMRDQFTVYDPRWYIKLDADRQAVRDGIAVLEMVGGVSELPEHLEPTQVTNNETTTS